MTASVLFAATLVAAPALGQSGTHVLVVVNERSADSIRIGDSYTRARGIPADQIVRVAVPPADDIDRTSFERDIEGVVAQWLVRRAAHDRILYIVLTSGVPLRIRGTSDRNGTVASVDSELTLLYRRLCGVAVPTEGPVANPYFLGSQPMTEARPFTHRAHDIFLVARLDGFAWPDVQGLIDRGLAPVRTGRVLLDQKGSGSGPGGDRWLESAARWLESHGHAGRVVLDTSSKPLLGEADVIGYASWGSNDPAIRVRRLGLTFVPGAIAATFVSTDGRTMRQPPATWTVGSWNDRRTFFADSPQSLAADLIHDGVTGVAGHVAEPYLDATIRPDILFPAYFSGFNLVESYYLAMPYLSWQTVVVGDPLCTPFPRKPVETTDLDPGMNQSTELPVAFSARRLRVIAARGANPDVARLLLRAEARTGRGDKPGAMTTLEEVTAMDGKLAAAQLLLATLYDEAGAHDKAIDRYRKVLDVEPNETMALNNLAFALAVRRHAPVEALPYAERAAAGAPRNPDIADTRAWVLHLLGRDPEAVEIYTRLVQAFPKHAQYRLHHAFSLAGAGLTTRAAAELREALRLRPESAAGADVQQLMKRLGVSRDRTPSPSR